MSNRVTGTIKWFNSQKGYGFITQDGQTGGKDMFVHRSAVEKAGLGDLQEGQRLSYDVVAGKGGKSSAENLQLVS